MFINSSCCDYLFSNNYFASSISSFLVRLCSRIYHRKLHTVLSPPISFPCLRPLRTQRLPPPHFGGRFASAILSLSAKIHRAHKTRNTCVTVACPGIFEA